MHYIEEYNEYPGTYAVYRNKLTIGGELMFTGSYQECVEFIRSLKNKSAFDKSHHII